MGAILIVNMGILWNERKRGKWAFLRKEGSSEAAPEKLYNNNNDNSKHNGLRAIGGLGETNYIQG